MNDFLTFLQEYYYLIVSILIVVILVLEVILALKGNKNPSVLGFIDKVVPTLINEAEKKYGEGHGDDKFLYVLKAVGNSICDVYGIKSYSSYERYISKTIETVLSTPQKKED